MLTARMTVTLMPPGLTVSWQPTQAPTPPPPPSATRASRPVPALLALIATVTLWPACSRPEDGVTVSLPSRPADSVMDHDTGPPVAVSRRDAPSSGLTVIVLGVTPSVPGAGGGVEVAVLVLADGAGELGEGLWLDDDDVGEGPRPGDVPTAAGEVPPAAGEGDTRAAPLAGAAG